MSPPDHAAAGSTQRIDRGVFSRYVNALAHGEGLGINGSIDASRPRLVRASEARRGRVHPASAAVCMVGRPVGPNGRSMRGARSSRRCNARALSGSPGGRIPAADRERKYAGRKDKYSEARWATLLHRRRIESPGPFDLVARTWAGIRVASWSTPSGPAPKRFRRPGLALPSLSV